VDYPALLATVRSDVPAFYERIVRTLDLRWDKPWDQIVDLRGGKPFAGWFVGARFNAAANCLDRHVDAGRGGETALFAQLRHEVARLRRRPARTGRTGRVFCQRRIWATFRRSRMSKR
jgi:hypothetical protein